jgi:Flp pilus assembly protein TadD
MNTNCELKNDQIMNEEEKQLKAEEYFKQGNAYYDWGDYARAIESYNKVIELKPDYEAYFILGIAYVNQGDYAMAIKSYNKAIKLKPDYEAYYNLGIAYRKQSDYARAIESYNKAIELMPDYAEAHYNLGNAYYEQGDYARAIESYNKAIEKNPDYAGAYYNLGIVYDNQEDYAKAIESYNKAIEIKPDYAEAYYNLIELCQNRKDEYVDKVAAILNNNKKNFKKDIVYIMSLYPNIDELIRKLLDTDYDDFPRMLKKYNITDKKSEEYEIYEKIYLTSNKIMQLLHVNNEEETRRGLAHYTRKIIAEALLIKEKKDVSSIDFLTILASNNPAEEANTCLGKAKNEEGASPFRLNSIITSNDPTEGAIAFEYLGLKNEEKDRNYQAFIACFTFDHECLNQFRLYGKDQGKEATGVSLVFRKDFFAEKPAGMAQSIASKIDYNVTKQERKDSNIIKQGTKEDNVVAKQDTKQNAKEEYALYRCVYIDPETKQIMALGHKDDYTFFRDKLDDKRKKGLSDEEKKELSKDEKDEVNREIETYKQEINKNLIEVRKEFDELKKIIQENKEKYKIEEKLVCDLLINLRYLVKHIAFKEEQECRVVKVASLLNHDKVKLKGDSMYMDTRTIDKLVDRIYFAPSATDMELFHEKLVHAGLDKIECRKCTHPIRIAKT